jgi:NhaA family Na+:H+ antiporter
LVTLNQDIGYREVLGVSMLCGIGFTMSLFVGMLAFDEQIVAMLNTVKISVLIASLTSALLGLSFIRLYCKERS